MKVTIETITPQDAERLLQHNSNNRSIRKNRVALYAKQISSGQWQATGEAIKFSKSGRLIDGQHRLHAIVLSGISAQFLVIRELDDVVFKVLDSGLTRAASDVVRALGVSSATEASAITRMYLVARSGLSVTSTHCMSLITKTDIADYVESNKELLSDTTLASRSTLRAIGGSGTAWGAARLLASETVGVDKFDEFIAGVISGAGLSAGDPRLSLRNWLGRNFKATEGGYTSAMHLGTYMKAFVAYVNDERITLLRVWDKNKEMPMPVVASSTPAVAVYP